MQIRHRRAGAFLALVGAATAAALSAGCGGGSSDPTARIKGVDLSATAGTAGVLANGTALGGDLTFGQSSPYLFVGQNLLTGGFTDSTGAPAGTTITLPASPTLQVNTGSYYTAYLIGQAALPDVSVAKPDPRLLQTVLTGDKGAAAGYSAAAPYADPPAGSANVRILNGASDAGPVDVLVNGRATLRRRRLPRLPRARPGHRHHRPGRQPGHALPGRPLRDSLGPGERGRHRHCARAADERRGLGRPGVHARHHRADGGTRDPDLRDLHVERPVGPIPAASGDPFLKGKGG